MMSASVSGDRSTPPLNQHTGVRVCVIENSTMIDFSTSSWRSELFEKRRIRSCESFAACIYLLAKLAFSNIKVIEPVNRLCVVNVLIGCLIDIHLTENIEKILNSFVYPCWKNTIVLPWYTMVNHGIAVVPHRCTMVYHNRYHGTNWYHIVIPWYTMVHMYLVHRYVPWYTTTWQNVGTIISVVHWYHHTVTPWYTTVGLKMHFFKCRLSWQLQPALCYYDTALDKLYWNTSCSGSALCHYRGN